jgi:hypothetical protein
MWATTPNEERLLGNFAKTTHLVGSSVAVVYRARFEGRGRSLGSSADEQYTSGGGHLGGGFRAGGVVIY